MSEEQKFDPYDPPVKSIVLEQLTQNGWVELIRLPLIQEITPDQVQEVIENIHEVLYKSEKAEFSIQGCQLCLKGLDESQTTFRIVASPILGDPVYIA